MANLSKVVFQIRLHKSGIVFQTMAGVEEIEEMKARAIQQLIVDTRKAVLSPTAHDVPRSDVRVAESPSILPTFRRKAVDNSLDVVREIKLAAIPNEAAAEKVYVVKS